MPFNDCCIYFSLLFTVSKKSTKSVQRKIVILNSAATVTTWQTSDNYVFCNFYVKKYDLSCLNYALFCCSCSGASATNELRPLRAVLSCCLRWATCNMCLLHLLLHSSSPCVLGGLPLLLCPCGFHWTTVLWYCCWVLLAYALSMFIFFSVRFLLIFVLLQSPHFSFCVTTLSQGS